MKRSLPLYILLTFLSIGLFASSWQGSVSEMLFSTILVKTEKEEIDNRVIDSELVFQRKISKKTVNHLQYQGLSVIIPEYTLSKDLRVSIFSIKENEHQPLPMGLVNVTRGVFGYRILPQNITLKKEIQIAIDFDENKIPEGYTRADVEVFALDTYSKQWRKLKKDKLEVGTGTIKARANGFSDFITGVIKQPESPDTTGFTPTTITGLKATEPFVGIENISVSAPNSQGVASATFPILLPKGRGGLEPHLQISYQQDNGQTWLGTGWDLSLSSINIDTKWGSPRYDADKETETYLFSGEELLPNAHRNAWEDREEDKAFFPRREGGFSKIIRVGNSPKNYFWKTHSKSGITTYYGNPNAQLSDHNGNIGYWAISKQEDLYGNQITYEYTSEKGILYPKSIYYTGYRGERGNYSVHFFTDKDLGEPQRLDLQTIARLGFKQEHNRLLRKIEVRYKDQPIKSYELLYKTGAYHKTLLKEIVIYDAKEKEFYRHQMEYYDDVRDGEGNYQPFGDFQKWAVPNDNIGYTFLGMDGFSGKATLAGTSNSQTTGGNFRIGVGTLKGRFNEYTLGGSGNYSTGKTQSKVLLQDIDGDNLPDKIYVKDHKVYYRKNISNQGNSHRFSDEIHQLNLPSLGVTQSSSSGFGVDLQLQKAIIGYNRQTSKSTTNSYFMDFNADGLVDFVSGGMVYYNRLVAGIPYFTPNSTGTPVPISISSTELSITGQTSLDKDSLRRNNPLHDVVRSWTAPYDGTLQIQHRYHLIEDLSDQRKNYTKNDGSPKADGVELYFQHHKNLVWKEKINPDDYTEKSKTNTITIKRGETLYFRVSSIYDGNYDRTEWHTDLRYLSISHPIKDINGEDLHLYHTKEDLYSTAQSFVFSEIVKPRLIGTFSKPKTTDKVKLIVLKENLSTETTTIVFEQQFEEGEETEFDLSSIDLGTFQNSESLQLRLVSDTQLHWNSISINPQISYHSELTNKTETAVLAVDYTVFHRQDDLGADYFHTPIEGMLDFGFGALLPKTFKDLSGDITITAKQNGKVLTRKNYTVIGNKQTQIVIITPKGSPIINEQASIDGAISVEIIVRDGQGNSEIVQWMNENKVPIALSVNDNILHQNWMKYWLYEPLEAPYLPTLFGKTYRGWGSFILNGDLAKDLIDENQLKDHQGEYNGSDIHNFNPDNGNGYGMEIANVYFLRTTSITGQRTHTGSESDIFINENHYSPSRLGENDLENYLDTTLPPLAGGVSRALAIVTESKSNAYATGVSASGVGGIGGSYSRGESRVKQTMSDFNGDRFPDFIRGGNVQFTEPKGGISTQYLDIGDFTTSKTETVGGSADGSIRHGTPKNSLSITIGKNKLHANNTATQGKDDAEKAKNSIGVSASQSLGNDYAEHTYTDMNGDGLADRITSSTIQYNIGYGFLPAEPWDFETLSRGSNQDVGAGLGYSLFGGSFRGGLNYSRSISQLKTQFLDVTGDGLADKLVYTDAKTSIFQNLGNRFSNLPIEVSTNQRTAENISISYGGGANFSYEFKLEFIGLRFSITAGAFHGTNANRIEATFIDIDGDGNLDYVLSEDEDDLKVALSNHKRTHLLKSIKNATGSTIELDYEWKAPTYDNPNSQWVLSQITTNDGHEGDGEDTTITAITYQNPYYDRYERMFYGYELLTQKSIHPRDNSTMRTAVQHFYNQDFYTRGLLKSAYTLDETNQKLTETHTEYTSYPLDTNTKKLDLSHPISHQWIAANRLSPNVYSLFTPPVKTTTKTFEGDGFLEHTTLKTYDEYGNLATYIDKGTGDATSEIIADITYHENETPYFGAIPKSIIIKDLKQILRHRTAEIHPQTGAIIQIKQYADVQTPSVTDLSYDAYGNLNEVKNAENYKGERTHLKYQYDEDNHSHIVKITDQFGYENTIEYDYRYNTPTQQTDRNGQTIHYTLDDKGRISSILAPKEAEAGKPYTIAYDYYPSAEVPYAKTKNHDPEHNTDIETYTYADGLGRIVQVKKTASVFKGKNTEDEIKHIISGKQIYDPLGRIIATYYPTTADSSEAYQVVPSLQAPTTVEYDSKDRVILHTFPDQSTLRTSFSIEEKNGIPHLKTTQTDALGRSTSTFTDVLGRQTAMIQANRIETQFQYNALGEILEVKDHDGNTTESTYDLLGRRTKYTHPDAGTLVMVYDKAGNLIKRQTSQIREEMSDAFIEYHYEYTRLKEIKYPKYPDNNVRYHYGTAEETASRRGRLWLVEDASGGVEYFFGNIGEIIKEIRTIRISPTEIQTYVTESEYDSWNRIQKLTYPDGEILDYGYNRAGKLNKLLASSKKPIANSIIEQQGYDEFEQKVYRRFGNGVETHYTYDPVMRRLVQLKAETHRQSPTAPLQNNHYQYDLVGNILSIENAISQSPMAISQLGGSSRYAYEYDVLNRLTKASGQYNGSRNTAEYELNMSYNVLNGITQKSLKHTVNGIDKGYTLNYQYENRNHPNAPSVISGFAPLGGQGDDRRYTYDGNGNPTGYEEFKSFRMMVWDEENRLRGINDNGLLHLYTYDHTGERTLKSSSETSQTMINGATAAIITHNEDYTAYVSPYFVVQKGRFTKHYFEGASRISSKLGEGTFTQNGKGITAGGIDYLKQTALLDEALRNYIKSLNTPPGPPTQQGIYASPEWTGQPYPSIDWEAITQNQEPPEGWPRPPKFNEPGDVPGPPVQFGDPITPETVEAGFNFVDNGVPERNIYYYHPDHLGSSSHITDINGNLSQHTEFMAFGEILFDEHSTSITMPYLFNGKELDQETNLTYYGARYLDMKTSLWLNTDPLAEKYPETSAYTYTLNNPIRLVDPDGMAPEDIILRGKNNSSLTIKTDIVDISLNVSSLGIDFRGNHTLVGNDILEAALDIGGLVDQTGIIDGAAAIYHGNNGDWGNAIISGLSVVPGGDLLKLGKVPKHMKTIEKAIDGAKAEQRAAKLSKVNRAGKDFTKAGKEAVIDLTKVQNKGNVPCASCGVNTVPATKSVKGVTPPKIERQVDHIKPKSKGGSGTPNNGQVLCRDCNVKKGNKE